MIKWLLKNIFASIEIKDGAVKYSYPKIPKGFINDLNDVFASRPNEQGLLYIKMKNRKAHIHFMGSFETGTKQRVLNCWGIHKDRYK